MMEAQMLDENLGDVDIEIPFILNDVKRKSKAQIERRIQRINAQQAQKLKEADPVRNGAPVAFGLKKRGPAQCSAPPAHRQVVVKKGNKEKRAVQMQGLHQDEEEVPFRLNDVKPKSKEQLERRKERINAQTADKIKKQQPNSPPKAPEEEKQSPAQSRSARQKQSPVYDREPEQRQSPEQSAPANNRATEQKTNERQNKAANALMSRFEETKSKPGQTQPEEDEFNDPPIVAFPIATSKTVVNYNVVTGEKFTAEFKRMPYMFTAPNDDRNFIPWVFLDENSLMICGGLRIEYFQNHTYIYNFKTEAAARKSDMIEARIAHGMYRQNEKVYAFSGQNNFEPITSNEFYDIDRDQWNNLPHLPVKDGILFATVACVGSDLYITGMECEKIIMFKTNARRFVALNCNLPLGMENNKIISNGENLFVIELDQVLEYTTNGEPVATYNTNRRNVYEDWLAGPPIYVGNKAYFSGNAVNNTNLYCFDFGAPNKGLFVSQENCFSL